MADVDWSDPCAAAAALTASYYKVLSGSQRETVRFVDREVRYTRANLSELRQEMDRKQQDCDIKNGVRSRGRFAVTASSRRPPGSTY